MQDVVYGVSLPAMLAKMGGEIEFAVDNSERGISRCLFGRSSTANLSRCGVPCSLVMI